MKILLYILSLNAFVNCFAQEIANKHYPNTAKYKQTKTFDYNDVHFNTNNTNTEKEKKYDSGIRLAGFYWYKIFSVSPSYYIERKRHAFNFGVQSYFDLSGYYEIGPIIGYKKYLTNNKRACNFYLLPTIYLFYIKEENNYRRHFLLNNNSATGFELAFNIGLDVKINNRFNIGSSIGIGYRRGYSKGNHYFSATRLIPSISIRYLLKKHQL